MKYQYLRHFEDNVVKPTIIRLVKNSEDLNISRYTIINTLNRLTLTNEVVEDIINLILSELNFSLEYIISEVQKMYFVNFNMNKNSLINYIKNQFPTYYFLTNPLLVIDNTSSICDINKIKEKLNTKNIINYYINNILL
ncbi:MAG: hypothetical protein IKT40_11880 [Bacilli bacterium]|nr:hypothetical protein [Bacilli bacterium]